MFIRLCVAVALLGASVAAAQETETEAAAPPRVRMHTSMGVITLELYPELAPATVENFLQYVADGYYEGTIFHRVISHFMIQGGGFTEDMERKPTREPITNEADNGLKNSRGTIAMARTSNVNSATSQFFINVQDNLALDHTGTGSSREWGYAVFGKVVEGMEVVDEIRFAETGMVAGMADVPDEVIVIERVEVIE